MAKTLFRGPVLQGKFNEAGLTGFNLENKQACLFSRLNPVKPASLNLPCSTGPLNSVLAMIILLVVFYIVSRPSTILRLCRILIYV